MKQRKNIEQQIIVKAMKDPGFRQRLLENPRAVIREETGVELPAHINLSVLEEDPQTVYLVIPTGAARPDETDLTENELKMVAGGMAQDPGANFTIWHQC
jgi:hypothetical protein